MRYREQYPTATVSLTAQQRDALAAVAARYGYSGPRRGPSLGGLLRTLLDRVWPWLALQGCDPSQCDISREDAWMLREMRLLREREPARWAVALRAIAECAGAEPPAEIAAALEAALPPTKGARRRP